jgi:Ca2+/Na+ antiporter
MRDGLLSDGISAGVAYDESMAKADPKIRAARNGFLVLIVLLLTMSVYQFMLLSDPEPLIAVLWIVGAAVFYASRYYYRRQENTTAEESAS